MFIPVLSRYQHTIVVCWGGGLNKYQSTGADRLQRPLRSRFRRRLTAGVRPQKTQKRRNPRRKGGHAPHGKRLSTPAHLSARAGHKNHKNHETVQAQGSQTPGGRPGVGMPSAACPAARGRAVPHTRQQTAETTDPAGGRLPRTLVEPLSGGNRSNQALHLTAYSLRCALASGSR